MRKAVTTDGEPVTAGPDAPGEARCPTCGGRVVLRRRGDGGRETWYYRHVNGEHPSCPRRWRPWR
ncbi:MAG TPA: hypothetical protein EYP77_02565 [Anaerolineae bacterium]|nr:hypothetical protein [Anaerolineae bacterium]